MSLGLRPCIPLLCSVAALWACAAPANSASQLQLYIQDRTYQLGVYGPTQQAIYTVAIHALRSTLRDVKTPKPFLLDPLIYDGVVYPVHLTALDTAWTAKAEMPADNAAAGIPPRDKIVGNLIKDVNVAGGAITLTYGNNAARMLDGKRLTLRPAVVADQPLVPIAWICHRLPVPKGMEARGRDETDIPPGFLPLECRGPAEK